MTAPIDFTFRPGSYWDPTDPESAVVGNIKGQLRREMVRDFLRGKAADELGELEDQYLDDEVDDQLRRSLGSHHPHFLGGEYLPPYLPGEVEIARVVLQSSTLDVHSLRARRRGGRIWYRMVDEYDGIWTLRQQTSRRPLSFGQLVDLLIRAKEEEGLAGDYPTIIMDYNVDEGADPEYMASFVSMESVCYPQLAQWWEERVAEWLVERKQEMTEEE